MPSVDKKMTGHEVSYILQMSKDEQKRLFETCEERFLSELRNIIEFDIGELLDEQNNLKRITDMPEHVRQAIANVEVRLKRSGEYDEDGHPILSRSVGIKTHDKLKALMLIGKHLGCFLPMPRS